MVVIGVGICLTSGIGGTGKTFLTANLGVALSEKGKNVLILDADNRMENLALYLGLEKVDISLQSVLSGEADVQDAVFMGPSGIKVVPAGISADGLKNADADRLEDILRKLLKNVDILLLNTPSELGAKSIITLASAQEVMLVVTPDISSISGALRTKICARRLGVNMLGVVVNKMDSSEEELSVKEIEILLETEILGVLPKDLDVSRAASFGEPLILKFPNSPTAIAIDNLASKLLRIWYLLDTREESLSMRLTKGLLKEN